MIALPFIFFLILFLRTWKRNGFDVYAYMLLLFVVISFFSILLDGMNLYSDYSLPKDSVGVIAPISYCILLFVCIRPYRDFYSNKIKIFQGVNTRIYNWIVYIYFFIFVITLLISLTRLNDIINAQSLASMRNDFYQGDDVNVWTRFSGITRFLVAIIAMMSSSARIMLLFFFINIVYLKKGLLFNIITLLASLTPLLMSLYNVDRSGFVYWFLQLGLMLALFGNSIKKEDLKNFIVIGIPVLLVAAIYLVNVTVSRFGEDDGGVGGLVSYAGMSFINYCLFFNKLDMNAPFSLVELFPFTYNIILHLPSYFQQCDIVSKYCGFGVATFSTFLGLIMSMSGKIVTLLYVTLYVILSKRAVYRRNKQVISFRQLILFYIFSIVIVNGLFGYCYIEFPSIFHILIWLLIAKMCTPHQNRVKRRL